MTSEGEPPAGLRGDRRRRVYGGVPALLVLGYALLAILRPGARAGESDWTPFAVGGRLLLSAAGHVYDRQAELAVQLSFVHGYFQQPGQGGLLPFVSPPWVALLSAVFLAAGFEVGGQLWILGQLASLGAGMLLVTGRRRALQALAGMAALPTMLLLTNAQLDGLVVLGLGLAYRLNHSRKPLLAGAALGLTLAKPHLVLVLAAGLVATRSWRLLLGWAGAGAVLAAACTAIEPRLLPDWIAAALGNAGRIGVDITLPGLLSDLGAPWPATAALALAVAAAAVVLARRCREPSLGWAVLIAAGLLVAPHALATDLVIASFAMVLAGLGGALPMLALSAATMAVLLAPEPVLAALGGTLALGGLTVLAGWRDRLPLLDRLGGPRENPNLASSTAAV